MYYNKDMKYYRPIFGLLLVTALAAGLYLSITVFYGSNNRFNSEKVTALPSFSATDLLTRVSISDQDMRLPAVVNVWASWCGSCLYEHPVLLGLHQEGVTIYGINHKDNTADAIEWLGEHGDPFARIIEDISGSLGNTFGVYGVPETLLIDKNRQIIVRHRGTLSAKTWQKKFLPLWQEQLNEA